MEENIGLIDRLASIVTNFDMSYIIPELDTLLGWVDLAARLSVIVGPALMLVLGILYYFLPPQEANHRFGYRFYWGMGSVPAWQFTQRIAGVTWMAMGLVLALIMFIVSLIFGALTIEETVSTAVICLLIQLVLMGGLCLAIDAVVMLRYNRKGDLRPNTIIRVSENFLELKYMRNRRMRILQETTAQLQQEAAQEQEAILAEEAAQAVSYADESAADAPQEYR